MTFAHRVAYLGGVCCRRLLFSALILLGSRHQLPIYRVEGLYFGGEASPMFQVAKIYQHSNLSTIVSTNMANFSTNEYISSTNDKIYFA